MVFLGDDLVTYLNWFEWLRSLFTGETILLLKKKNAFPKIVFSAEFNF